MIEVKLIPATTQELRTLIYNAYLGDTDLIEKYQAGNRTFDECVDFNYNEILDHCNDPIFAGDVHLWKVVLQSADEIDDIGYCVTVTNDKRPHQLLSFAINMEYRKRVFLIDWLRAVQDTLGEPYYTMLWNKNTRAIDFFVKNGFEAVKSEDNTFKYLIKGIELMTKNEQIWR